MIKPIKMITEYLIRHLKLNTPCISLIDRLVTDQTDGNYHGAKDLLREVYKPESFIQKDITKEVSHQYNLQIIIPMYNVRKYIKTCLNSILQQKTRYTYKIFLVDDGSTDGTPEQVAQLYHDERICLISQVNSGAAVARNTALETLIADYIMFVDADDKLKNGAIDCLLDAAYKNDADVVEGSYEVFRGKIRSKKTHKDAVLHDAVGKLWGFSWVKVIRAGLFMDLQFPDRYWYEDTIISYLIYTRCKKIVTVSDVIYSYRKSRKGMSHIRGKNTKMLDAFWIIDLVLNEMIRREIPLTQSIYEQLLVSLSTSTKRVLYLDHNLRRCVLAAYSEILHTHFEGYQTAVPNMKVFEKVLWNNDYHKYRYVAIGMESL